VNKTVQTTLTDPLPLPCRVRIKNRFLKSAISAQVGGDEPVRDSTKKREAVVQDFPEQAKRVCTIPLAVTGGFRSRKGMDQAHRSHATDMVGLARPMVLMPDLPSKALANKGFVFTWTGERKIAENLSFTLGSSHDKLLEYHNGRLAKATNLAQKNNRYKNQGTDNLEPYTF